MVRFRVGVAIVLLVLGSGRGFAETSAAGGRVSFVNDVIPALTRAGCNQGSCHGAAAGKGGFKLSLRGYAPELDYVAIMRQANGRRVTIAVPEQSLLLKKPLMEVAHRGGPALVRNSEAHRILLRWMRQGAEGPQERDPHVVRLEVTPPVKTLAPKAELALKVTARFSDGTQRDVTRWAHFATNDENVATVRPSGAVTMVGAGETGITVGYQDKVAVALLAVPYANKVTAEAFRGLKRANIIDEKVNAKLAQMNLWPSRRTTDAEFARRLSLDLVGVLPTAEELQAFVADKDPKKREKRVEALMARPEFTDFWAYKWSDLLRVNRGMLKDKGMWAFYAWVRDSVRTNKPWDQMTREVMTATGNTFLDGPANYFRTALKPEELTENISQGFLGVRLQCAKCHNHPLEKWTQNEYYGMASIFARVGRKANYDVWVNDEMTVYNQASGEVMQPRLGRPIPPKPLGGPELALNSLKDRRTYFANWLTSPKNKQFSMTVVNRVWAHFMGRGLVEAVDDIRETNPPTNIPLMDALTADFVAHKFDLRHLMKTIVLSEAYQRSSEPNARNRQDDRFYSRYLVKRLTAEELLDALCQVTGQAEKFPDMPSGVRALQLPDTHVKSEFMDSFGRPARQITCECERSQEPSMAQALVFINSEVINKKVTADGGLVDRLVKEKTPDGEILDTLYWTALGRAPYPKERTASLAALTKVVSKAGKDAEVVRRRAFEDMLWVLVNSKEFLFNH